MPACSSDVFATGTRYRSSSPPNSRSNSASPPLSWPIGPGSPLLSSSPSHTPSTGIFRRSISNLSNSSLSHGKTFFSDQHKENLRGTIGSQDNSMLVPNSEELFRRRQNVNTMSSETLAAEREKNFTTTNVSATNGEFAGDSERSLLKKLFFPARLIEWYANLIFRLYKRLNETLNYLIWAPIIWISAWLCVFWILIQLPLNLVKWFAGILYTPSLERSRNKRCVLITGGSTVQALHLARNFHRAGARVVVCEIEGLFGLARFSTACSRYYNLPRPGPGTAAEYVKALKTIVEREKVLYFIPVSCTSGAYYDSLAKPHLETMGCECFVPGVADVTSLEDPLQLIQRCVSLGLPSPTHRVISSIDDLTRLYENGYFATIHRHVMISAGPAGMNERSKLHLPGSVDNAFPQNLRRKLETREISEKRPWIIIRETADFTNGYQLVTCTTVKDSRIVANVTCRLDETRGLVPEERNDVDQWLENFFQAPFAKRINGHLSFKLAFNTGNSQELVPISCRVGVSLPYLCHTSVHPRLVWRPCRHFSRQHSVNLIVNDKYKKSLLINQRSASTDGLFSRTAKIVEREPDGRSNYARNTDSSQFSVHASPVLDKRDVLFVCWDPLPYCAYYHLQFPFRRLAGAIRRGPAQHKPPLAIVR